ncbi:glycine-rich cell wall structural protein 1.8 isoform X3 [Nilaparvata lugens]|uniref:glycine-rich cell wall structural protein 1.8 isoform X3 n=1 Tax=Nilaparvata lugens TaxID=108931 RepID=UPI00193C969C|nr:glycine-rich cell wall structural protein 1.8 isoform X3 [Nilaparvata lugens]
MDFKALIFFGALLIDSCISFDQGGHGGRELDRGGHGTRETYQGGHDGDHGRYLGGYYDIDDYVAVGPPPQIVLDYQGGHGGRQLDQGGHGGRQLDQGGHGGRKLDQGGHGTRETYQGGHDGDHGRYLGGYYDIDDYVAVGPPPQIVLDYQGGHGGRQLDQGGHGGRQLDQGGHGGHRLHGRGRIPECPE